MFIMALLCHEIKCHMREKKNQRFILRQKVKEKQSDINRLGN